ncbi:MAG: RiPP maturation radical SAM C-methyltransferase [Deltaproteobacteria bacterium]|nr:RiPP maturation radical SAM C-methyltransferase [Deltaproteobacteria bacterium]
MSKRVLLVNPPWFNPNVASIALGTLRPILERAGIEVDTLHGNLLFPRTDMDPIFIEHFAGLYFVPHTYPETDSRALFDRVIDWYFDDLNGYGVLHADPEANSARFGLLRDDVRLKIEAEIERAGVCLQRCLERAGRPEYDIVGFSLTFETQIPAALAMARKLRASNPDVKIILGGAACFEEQADGLVASFNDMDAVCHTEADEVIVKLIRALRGECALEDVPGIAFRDASGALRHNPSPPLFRNLDSLPVPLYDDYFTEFARSEWSDTKPRVMFETARGCWWGEKHLCSYCGLNGEGLAFRAKSPQRSFAEIKTLYETYPLADCLQAVDNIMDMGFFHTVLPELAAMERQPERPLKIFYEVKANLKPQHLALLAAAGVTAVQPGIESFDDEVLKLMDKGCTGLGQVQFVKWAFQEGVTPCYQMLICNPGESKDAYVRMLDLLPFITHLPPPGAVTKTQIERFSPLYDRAASFGIRNMRPKPHYAALYPEPGVDLMRISYQFDYDHDMYDEPDRMALYREFAEKVMDWCRTWTPGTAYFIDRGESIAIVDLRSGERTTEVLAGVTAELFRYLDSARTFDAIAKHFPRIDPLILRGLLERWRHRRWIYSNGDDRHLAVLGRRYLQPRAISEVIAAATARPAPTAEATLAKGKRIQLALVT